MGIWSDCVLFLKHDPKYVYYQLLSAIGIFVNVGPGQYKTSHFCPLFLSDPVEDKLLQLLMLLKKKERKKHLMKTAVLIV